MNGQTLGSVELTADWKDETLAIPHDALRPAENRLTFAFERQSRPADHGPSKDQRSLAGAVAPFSILDSAGEVVVTFDPIYGRFDLIHGFHQPEAKVVEAQSTHMRAAPVWNLRPLDMDVESRGLELRDRLAREPTPCGIWRRTHP